MRKYRLLDLFCRAGGAAMGYHRAGFEVVGVDIKHQPRYPFTFIQGDALEYVAAHGREFDAIHASPPCQGYSDITIVHGKTVVDSHPRLISQTRDLIIKSGPPLYIIENVKGARRHLISPLMLCGSMFSLEVQRHRYFEGFVPALSPFSCRHDYFAVPVYGHSGAGANRNRERERGRTNSVKDWARAMDIDWMTGDELAEAIPPAYTKYIGTHLLAHLERTRTELTP